MKVIEKVLFAAIAATLVFVGALAILGDTHTGFVRGQGQKTATGSDALWIGQTVLILAGAALLPLLPRRWVMPAALVWALGFGGWLIVTHILARS